jgi:large subunit ribosomal protein L24
MAAVSAGVRKSKIVKGDTVVLRRGKEKGKRGLVTAVFPSEGSATVEGLNVVKRHTKQGMGGSKSAGIFEKEAPLPLSVLMAVCAKCDAPRRLRYQRTAEGTQRVCIKCGEPQPLSAKGR